MRGHAQISTYRLLRRHEESPMHAQAFELPGCLRPPATVRDERKGAWS